eukprot:TRINITY_DN5643_c0_g1_i1.p1 TRINITY_DN5643_c0_g1~~TRINITY_DN5643_c0_g1_i1.p1  ORF type:complete len:268 (+),score=90.68 TRINITY_DN5643_c0_g1_i1:129-932(+)
MLRSLVGSEMCIRDRSTQSTGGENQHAMPAIDYSKWDAMEFSESDDEPSNPKPTVTRLDPGTAVTIGQQQQQQQQQEEEEEEEEEEEWPETAGGVLPPTLEARNTSVVGRAEMGLNGGETGDGAGVWCQDKGSCTLSVWVPAGTKARDTTVRLNQKQLGVWVKGAAVLEGTLAHEVEEPEDGEAEWELKDTEDGSGRRVCRVVLIKKAPGGVTIWWPRLLDQDENDIDTTQIQGRRNVEANKSAWEEAHRMFRQKVAQIVPEEIPIE